MMHALDRIAAAATIMPDALVELRGLLVSKSGENANSPADRARACAR